MNPIVRKRPAGFTLVEILLVVVLLVLLLKFALPTITSVLDSSRISHGGAQIAALIERGRMHATAMQRVVALRFYQGASADEFTVVSLVEMIPSASDPGAFTARPVAPALRLPEPIVISRRYSSILDATSPLKSGTETLPGSGSTPFRSFYIHPEGSTSLPVTSPHPYLCVASRYDHAEGPSPDNPYVLSIDPVTARVTIFRR